MYVATLTGDITREGEARWVVTHMGGMDDWAVSGRLNVLGACQDLER